MYFSIGLFAENYGDGGAAWALGSDLLSGEDLQSILISGGAGMSAEVVGRQCWTSTAADGWPESGSFLFFSHQERQKSCSRAVKLSQLRLDYFENTSVTSERDVHHWCWGKK